MNKIVNKAWPFEQTLNSLSTAGSKWNLVEIGQVVSEELTNIMILYMDIAQMLGKITLTE